LPRRSRYPLRRFPASRLSLPRAARPPKLEPYPNWPPAGRRPFQDRRGRTISIPKRGILIDTPGRRSRRGRPSKLILDGKDQPVAKHARCSRGVDSLIRTPFGQRGRAGQVLARIDLSPSALRPVASRPTMQAENQWKAEDPRSQPQSPLYSNRPLGPQAR
jgi:hypothetical protein